MSTGQIKKNRFHLFFFLLRTKSFLCGFWFCQFNIKFSLLFTTPFIKPKCVAEIMPVINTVGSIMKHASQHASICNFIKKENLVQVFSCEFCKIFKKAFFTEHLRMTASENLFPILLNYFTPLVSY